jgi:hypothetical protein
MMGRRRRTARKGNKRTMEYPKRRKELGRCSRESAAKAKPLDALEIRTEHGIQEMKKSPNQEIVESGCLSKVPRASACGAVEAAAAGRVRAWKR